MERFFANSIGVTGGLASGKSSVAKALADMLGYCLFDADAEVASLLKKEAEGWFFLRSLLAPDFFLKNGALDKPKLRDTIFEDCALRKKIEERLHPLVRKQLKRKVDEAYTDNGQKSLIEVPLLYEANWQSDFAKVLVVAVSENIAVARGSLRDGVTSDQIKKTLSAQFPLKEKIELADYVIDNDKNWDHTFKQIVQLKKILTP
nr:dephospho-CoA kinase [Desulfobulbaceae bacterium]